MRKYKLIIVPSSSDEALFDNAADFTQALSVLNEGQADSAQELSFDTEKERTCFIEGYRAAIGYNGDGIVFTDEQEENKTEPLYGIEAEGRTFARKCDATGEGMNEGFCFGDGDAYFKYEFDAIKHAKEIGYDTLEMAYEDEAYYFTAWEDESEHQYVIKGGELVEIED